MKKRIYKLTIALFLITVLGMGYAFIGVKFGIAMPCMFHEITGFYCPGCGVSRMCLFLLQGDLYTAFRYNPLVFCLLPFLGMYIVGQIKNYILGRPSRIRQWELVLWKVLAVTLILYGILRNLPGFSFLAPGV
ncbi:MAG: DUF2752 domain-containing protein [Acetivibrio sp.]